MRIFIFLLTLKILWDYFFKGLFFKFNAWGLKSKRNSNIGFTFLILAKIIFVILFIYYINNIFLFLVFLWGE